MAAVGVLGACAEATAPPADSSDGGPSAASVDPRLVHAHTGFGLKLFRTVAAAAGDRNVFMSPASVAFALSMTLNGADGETRAAMARALETQGMDLETLNAANAAWRAALSDPDPKVELAIANSLWGRQGVPFREDFLQRVRDAYASQVATLDFDSPSASRTINDWVSRSTRGKIPEIVPAQIDPETILFLINAIYFKGSWSTPFDPKQTRDGTWHLPGGATVRHPMMNRTGSYRVLRGDGFQAVGLPYGGGRLAMYIFVPEAGSSLAALRARLDAGEWGRWMSGFREERIALTMPRYRLEYEVGLNDALKALGMGVAFDRARADFGAMLPAEYLRRNNAYISQVKHKTFVEVNELGTEAAGATSVEVGIVSAPPSLVVDRPFLVAIRDDRTGTLLFLGQIVDPR